MSSNRIDEQYKKFIQYSIGARTDNVSSAPPPQEQPRPKMMTIEDMVKAPIVRRPVMQLQVPKALPEDKRIKIAAPEKKESDWAERQVDAELEEWLGAANYSKRYPVPGGPAVRQTRPNIPALQGARHPQISMPTIGSPYNESTARAITKSKSVFSSRA